MAKRADLSGKKFGQLTVLRFSRGGKNAYWECICDCGQSSIVSACHLKSGHTMSCGCHKTRVLASGNNGRTHGLSNKSSTYKTWKEMRRRCFNMNAHNWKWYGGKGVTVCAEWDRYETFLHDMGDRPEGKTLDRIAGAKIYSKETCRWATPKEQAQSNSGLFKKKLDKHN